MIPVTSHTISIDGLEKQFGKRPVLRGLDLQIEAGKVTAIVGPNSSGKTTLIKCLLGLVQPDAGRIFFDGQKLGRACQYRERIGYMPQVARFPENLTAADVLAMLSDLRDPATPRDDELLQAFDLDVELRKPLRTLSGGTRQKVSAVITFLFAPDFIILDEPTAGLDPVASSILKDKILREREAGKTLILTSHIMSEVEELADNVAFLLDGRVRFAGRTDELKQGTGQDRLERALAQLMTEIAA